MPETLGIEDGRWKMLYSIVSMGLKIKDEICEGEYGIEDTAYAGQYGIDDYRLKMEVKSLCCKTAQKQIRNRGHINLFWGFCQLYSGRDTLRLIV
jgi:hypothetical protein